jgi:hypothetical protein
VATGIREGTLEHRLYLPNRNWFAQLTDFFDVTDAPVIGYTPSVVLTELHLHLWNCAVSYKPIYLPLRSVLTMETFSISSNIAAQTSTSVVRFMSEDAAFFLTSNKVASNSTSLRDDYICVMEMDYFELSFRLCSNRSSNAPRIDLSANCNALHIRTCSDSFKALLELLTYFNNDGDLFDPNSRKDSDSVSQFSPIKESTSEPALITTEEIEIGELGMSASHTEHVHDLVAEAMKDASRGTKKTYSSKKVESKNPQPVYDLMFAPDYTDEFQFQNPETDFYQNEESATTTPLPSVPIMESSNGLPIDIHGSDEDEEEFFILENDPGVGIIVIYNKQYLHGFGLILKIIYVFRLKVENLKQECLLMSQFVSLKIILLHRLEKWML